MTMAGPKDAAKAGSAVADQSAMDIDAPASAGFSLDPETFKKIHPAEYHRRFLSQGVRADGRTLKKFRKAQISLGSISTANGSAMVRIGDTTVICGVKAEVTEPKPEAPKSGFIVPNLDLPPLCSPQYRPGPPPELAQTISEFMDQVIKSCDLLDTQTLCIEAGHAVWVLYIDIVCLNHGGNVADAAMIALIAALKHTRLPKARFYDVESTVRVTDERTMPLDLKRTPIPVTFGVFDNTILIADPTSEEEPHLSTQITFVLDAETHDSLGVLKPGGTALARDVLVGACKSARERALVVAEALSAAISATTAGPGRP